jgi:hypothetical protein
MNLEEQNLNETQKPQLNIGAVRRSALLWWNKLKKSKQRDYEMQMFGYGEWWEDNSLHEDDIVKMFQHCA